MCSRLSTSSRTWPRLPLIWHKHAGVVNTCLMSCGSVDDALAAALGVDELLFFEVERRLPAGCTAVRAIDCYGAMRNLRVFSRQEKFVKPIGEALLDAARDRTVHMAGIRTPDIECAGMIQIYKSGVKNLSVDAAAQGRGIGRVLLDAAIAALRASGVPAPEIWVDERNWSARRMYLRAGFEPTGETWPPAHTSLQMRWTGASWPPPVRPSARERVWRVVVGPGGGRDDLAERLRVELPHARVEVLDAPPADENNGHIARTDALLEPPAAAALYAHRIACAHATFDDDRAVREAAAAGDEGLLFWPARKRAAACIYRRKFTTADALVRWIAELAA